MIKPGKIGFHYTDASRDKFDIENEKILTEKQYPHTVFFGDSLTWYMPIRPNTFSFTWVNRGIPGDCAKFMQLRFEADVLQLLPKRLVMLCGVNDIINRFMNEEPYVNMTTESCLEVIFGSIQSMALKAKNNGIKVYLATVMPIKTPMGKVIDNVGANTVIRTLNANIISFCKQEDFECIDYYSSFIDSNANIRNELSLDGVHLNKLGYEVFFNYLTPILENEGDIKNETI